MAAFSVANSIPVEGFSLRNASRGKPHTSPCYPFSPHRGRDTILLNDSARIPQETLACPCGCGAGIRKTRRTDWVQ